MCEFEAGHIVGEMEFLHDHNNVADVVAKSEEVPWVSVSSTQFSWSQHSSVFVCSYK